MNLKNASVIALILIIASTLLIICGSILYFTSMLKDNINLQTLTSVFASILPVPFGSLGVVLLLSAVISRLSKPDSGLGSTLAVLAGVLILLCALITIITCITNAFPLYRYLPLGRFLYYMAANFFGIASNLTLGIFAFTISGRSSGKVLALLALISHVAILLINLGNVAISFGQSFAQRDFLVNLGSMGMILGSFGIPIAIIFFLLMFLKQKPWPPMADVKGWSPEPLPTLNAQAPLPG